jgi:hypothetical protein
MSVAPEIFAWIVESSKISIVHLFNNTFESLSIFTKCILHRDNGRWAWFFWRIRYQLIAFVENLHKPTSSSSPWTRTRDTDVIRHVPLQDLSWIEFQLILSSTQRVCRDFSSHLLMWIKWESAFMCDATPHKTDPGVLPSWALCRVTAFRVFIAADALWEYIVECLWAAAGILYFFELTC